MAQPIEQGKSPGQPNQAPQQGRRRLLGLGVITGVSALSGVGGWVLRGMFDAPSAAGAAGENGNTPPTTTPRKPVPTPPERANKAGEKEGLTTPTGLTITDLRGKIVVSAPNVPSKVSGSFDLADHPPFRNGGFLEAGHPNPLQNVLADPGAFLVDLDKVVRDEPGNLPVWKAKIARGEAEASIKPGEGPDVNFYDFQSPGGPGWSMKDGHWQFDLALPKHVIIRIDAEEGWVRLRSGGKDPKDLLVDLYQAGAKDGERAHHTLFIRTPYEDECRLTLEMPTVPGTQLQIFGMQVTYPTAFASQEAFLQGVAVRQASPAVPRYLVHGLNANDLTFGSAESPGPGKPFQHLRNNYLP